MPEAPYQSDDADRNRARLIGIIYMLLAIGLALMLFKIWPPSPWPTDLDLANNPQLAKEFADAGCPTPTPSPSPSPSPTPTTSPTRTGAGEAGTPVDSQSSNTNASATPTSTPSATDTTKPATTGADEGAKPAAAKPEEVTKPVTQTGNRSPVSLDVPIRIFGWCRRTSVDERLILLVIIAGMLGAFIHGATSLADFRGNNNFNKNWTWFYLLRPGIGMALALIFYFVIRGGFLSTSAGAKDINPYAIAALAGLVGMFSKQATDKLGEVFGTLFKAGAGKGDDKRSGPLKPKGPGVTITGIAPASVAAGSPAGTITVNGTGFVDGATVFLNATDLVTEFVSATQLIATLTSATIATQATFKLKVVNPDTTESAPTDFKIT